MAGATSPRNDCSRFAVLFRLQRGRQVLRSYGAGIEWVRLIVDDASNTCASAYLTMPEVSKAIRKKRNTILNQAGLTDAERAQCRGDFASLNQQGGQHFGTLWFVHQGGIRAGLGRSL